MKRLFLGTAKEIFALLILIAALVIPSYAQQLTTLQEASPARNTSYQNNEDANSNSSGNIKTSGQSASVQTTPTPTPSPSPVYVFPTSRERFNRYVKSTVGPFALLRTAVSAGINQWRDNPEDWEQGASGYGKRYASGFGKNAIQQTVIYGLDAAMDLDTGFRRSTRKGFGPRMKDALLEKVTSRNRSGNRVVSVPRFTGIYTSRIIAAETWYPSRYNYKDGLRSGTRSILTGFGMNLVREFIIRF